MADAADEYAADDDHEVDDDMDHPSRAAAAAHVQGLGAGDDVAFLLDEEFPPSNLLATLDEDVMVTSNNNSMDDLSLIRDGSGMILQNPAMAALSPTPNNNNNNNNPTIYIEDGSGVGVSSKKRTTGGLGSSNLRAAGDSGMDDGDSGLAAVSSTTPTSVPATSSGVTTRSQKNTILNLLNRNRKAAGGGTADSTTSSSSSSPPPPPVQSGGLSASSSGSAGLGSAASSSSAAAATTSSTTRLPAVQKINSITRSNSSLNLTPGGNISPSLVDMDLVDKLVRLHRQSINAFDEASRIEKNLLVGFATSGIGNVGGCSIVGGSSSSASSAADLEVYLRELDAVMEKKMNRIHEVRNVIQRILESGGKVGSL